MNASVEGEREEKRECTGSTARERLHESKRKGAREWARELQLSPKAGEKEGTLERCM